MSVFFNNRIGYSVLTILFLLVNIDTLQSQCNLLCNTDFENLQNCPSVIIVDTSLVPCWGTTASDNKIEVWHTGFNGVPSYSGNQFIELNAFFVSTLFQNFTAAPGQSLTVSFAHRGRVGVDVMGVEVGPVGGPYTSLGTFTDGNTAWGYYTVSYVVSSGFGTNFSLRFNSISATGGNPALGNFLDAISVVLPSNATLSLTSTAASCSGILNGTAQVSISGGAPPYTYTWAPSGGNTANAIGLGAGIYSVQIAEASGCLKTGTISVASGIPLNLTVSSQNVSCFGASDGSAQVSVNNGSSPYSYTWSPTGLNTASVSSLSSGIYTVNVLSSNGCTGTETVTIAQGTLLNLTTITQSVSCFGATDGSAQVTVNSGSSPYSYTWSPTGLNTASVSSLPSGIYTVNVLSSNGCVGSQSISIAPGLPINISVVSQSVSCFGLSDASAQASVLGGTGPYTYSWMPNGLSTPNVSGLSSGSYTVKSLSPNGCMGTKTFSINQPLPINVSTASQSVSCTGPANGTAQVFVNGGIAPYSYTWSPIANNSSLITGLQVGTYSCVINDKNQCSTIATVVLNSAPLPIIGVNSAMVCLGQSTTLTAYGALSYTWMPANFKGATFHDSPLSTTIYTVTGTDLYGCVNSNTASIVVNPSPFAFAGNDTTVNIDEPITLSGTGSAVYGWISMNNTIPLSCNYCAVITENPQQNTCYVLDAINSFNCRNSDTVCVTITQDWSIYIPNAFSPNNNDINDVFIPVGYGISEIELLIFDRWGELIFMSDDHIKGWNGTYKNILCKSDVYVYQVNIKTMSHHQEQRVGSVTLLK